MVSSTESQVSVIKKGGGKISYLNVNDIDYSTIHNVWLVRLNV